MQCGAPHISLGAYYWQSAMSSAIDDDDISPFRAASRPQLRQRRIASVAAHNSARPLAPSLSPSRSFSRRRAEQNKVGLRTRREDNNINNRVGRRGWGGGEGGRDAGVSSEMALLGELLPLVLPLPLPLPRTLAHTHTGRTHYALKALPGATRENVFLLEVLMGVLGGIRNGEYNY